MSLTIKEGLSNAAAIADGVVLRRKHTVDGAKLIQLLNNNMGATDMTKQLDLGRSTVIYSILNEDCTKDKTSS